MKAITQQDTYGSTDVLEFQPMPGERDLR